MKGIEKRGRRRRKEKGEEEKGERGNAKNQEARDFPFKLIFILHVISLVLLYLFFMKRVEHLCTSLSLIFLILFRTSIA